jgi:hypothetical protein
MGSKAVNFPAGPSYGDVHVEHGRAWEYVAPGVWRSVSLGSEIDWDDVNDKPVTFPPADHQHPISDVNGLQAALDSEEQARIAGDNALQKAIDDEAKARGDKDTLLDLRIDAIEDSITDDGGFIDAPNDGKLYGRQSENWSEIPDGGVSDWADIENKPTEFPPAVHNQPWSTITNTPSEYPPSSHNHQIGDVDGLQDALDNAGGNDPRISDTQITNWDDAYSWGDHSAIDYMRWSSFIETDPTVPDHVKAITTTDIDTWNAGGSGGGADPRISDTQISNWDTSYSWGDHKSESYLKVEADPVFTASPAFTITQTMIDDWNDATGSGGGGVEEAPSNGKVYGRQNEAWTEFDTADFVKSVNSKTPDASGAVALTHTDVGAEKAFTKNNAFNKNFGTSSGTVAQGNHTHTQYATTSHTHTEYATSGHTHSQYAGIGVSYTKAESDGKYELKGGGAPGGHNGTDAIQIAHKGISLGKDQQGSTFKSYPVIEMQSTSGVNGGLNEHTGYRLSVGMTAGWGDQRFMFNCGSTWGAYNATPALTIANAGCTSADFIATSDERLKDNITTVPIGLVDSLIGREWEWKESGQRASGVVAQEVEKVLPHVVSEDPEGTKAVSYGQLTAYLIEELKDCRRRIAELEDQKLGG